MTRFVACLLLLIAGTWLIAIPPYRAVPSYGPDYSAGEDLLKQILEELKGLRQDVKALGGVRPADGLALFSQRCSSCHNVKDAPEKGGSYVMFEADGSPSDLSLNDRRKIEQKVSKGAMPPGGGLPEAERRAILALIQPKQSQKERTK